MCGSDHAVDQATKNEVKEL